jgi:prophage regulatory protein
MTTATNLNLDPYVVAETFAEARRAELEKAAKAVIGDGQYFDANQLETFVGIRPSTWRYWASVGEGPASCKLGHRRRVWERGSVVKWLVERELACLAEKQ